MFYRASTYPHHASVTSIFQHCPLSSLCEINKLRAAPILYLNLSVYVSSHLLCKLAGLMFYRALHRVPYPHNTIVASIFHHYELSSLCEINKLRAAPILYLKISVYVPSQLLCKLAALMFYRASHRAALSIPCDRCVDFSPLPTKFTMRN